MDVRDLLAVFRRRWVIVGIMLVAVVAGAVVISSGVPLQYTAEGRIILEPPVGTDDAGVASNPLTGGGGLSQVADVVAQVVNDGQAHSSLEAKGAGDYVVSIPEGAIAPLLAVSASAAEPETALTTVQLVSDAISEELATQQELAGAEPPTFVTARSLLADEEAQPDSQVRTRAGIGIVVAGAAVGLTSVVVLDALLLRRRRPATRAKSEVENEASDLDVQRPPHQGEPTPTPDIPLPPGAPTTAPAARTKAPLGGRTPTPDIPPPPGAPTTAPAARTKAPLGKRTPTPDIPPPPGAPTTAPAARTKAPLGKRTPTPDIPPPPGAPAARAKAPRIWLVTDEAPTAALPQAPEIALEDEDAAAEGRGG